MQELGYHIIGEALIGMGKALQDPNSSLRKRFRLSYEQFVTIIGVIRVAASPDVQRKYIYEVADRWGVSARTIQNWVSLGLVRSPHTNAHDTRVWWWADELDEDERNLIKYGYLKPKKGHRVNCFVKMIKAAWLNHTS